MSARQASFASKILDIILCNRSTAFVPVEQDLSLAERQTQSQFEERDNGEITSYVHCSLSFREAVTLSEFASGGQTKVARNASSGSSKLLMPRTPEEISSDTPETLKRHSRIMKTTDSIVTFILEAVKELGSNLPGIGVVGVVLSAKDKLMVNYGKS